MSNGTKILIGSIVVIVIGVCVYVGISISKEASTLNQEENKVSIDNYINEILDEEENKNNIVENTENKPETNTNTNTNKEPEIVGKEEQESNQENTGLSDKETAIKLAQEEWGIDINSYIFEIELNSDGTYRVIVRNKTDRNAVTQYKVDVKAKTVVEE